MYRDNFEAQYQTEAEAAARAEYEANLAEQAEHEAQMEAEMMHDGKISEHQAREQNNAEIEGMLLNQFLFDSLLVGNEYAREQLVLAAIQYNANKHSRPK